MKIKKDDRILTGEEKDLAQVNLSLEQLVQEGDVEVVSIVNGEKRYRLTKQGEKHAVKVIKDLIEKQP